MIKMTKNLGWLAVVVTLSGSAQAHHSAAAFDAGAEFTVKATVIEWRWANPHCLLKFSVKGESGQPDQQWVAETSSPTDMARRGWVRNQLKAGDVVTVTIQPLRNGARVGRIVVLVQADGKKLTAYGRAAGGPAAAP